MRYLPHKKLLTDRYLRTFFNFYEKKKKLYKYLIKHEELSLAYRYYCSLSLYTLPKRSSLVYIKNRCLFTGRARGVLSSFKLSRQQFKRLVSKGFFCTILKK